MTDLLEQAFQHASKLTAEQQNTIALWLLQELESERIWEDAFVKSTHRLNSLAAEALSEKNTGKALPLDPDQL